MCPGPADDENTRYEAASMSDAIALDVPVGLFERARRHLLENEPLRARSSDRTAATHA